MHRPRAPTRWAATTTEAVGVVREIVVWEVGVATNNGEAAGAVYHCAYSELAASVNN